MLYRDAILRRTIQAFENNCGLIYEIDETKFEKDFLELMKFWTSELLFDPEIDTFFAVYKNLLPTVKELAIKKRRKNMKRDFQ
jgi:hypothetical protein